MIYLALSEAVVYDLLARTAVQAAHNPDAAAKGDLMLLDEQIQQQVGVLHHEQVCASEEYRALLCLNDAGSNQRDVAVAALGARWFTRV